MVGAVPTPEYEDYEYRRGLDTYFTKLEEEAKMQYYRTNGLMIWNVTESSAASYPLRSAWNKMLGMKREYQDAKESPIRYLTRAIKQGISTKETDHLFVTYRKIGLDFEITDLVTETIEKEKQELQLTMLSLVYQGWREAALVPSGQIYRGPDILQFPASLIRWKDILKEGYKENLKK